MSDTNLSLAISIGSAVFVGVVLPLTAYVWRERDSTLKRLTAAVAKLERAVAKLQVHVEHLLDASGHHDRHGLSGSIRPDGGPPSE